MGGSILQSLSLSLMADPRVWGTLLCHFPFVLSQLFPWLQMPGTDVTFAGGLWESGFQFLHLG